MDSHFWSWKSSVTLRNSILMTCTPVALPKGVAYAVLGQPRWPGQARRACSQAPAWPIYPSPPPLHLVFFEPVQIIHKFCLFGRLDMLDTLYLLDSYKHLNTSNMPNLPGKLNWLKKFNNLDF